MEIPISRASSTSLGSTPVRAASSAAERRIFATARPLSTGRRIVRAWFSGAVYSLAAETADVGVDAYSPVTDDYDPWDNAVTGTIHKVVVELTD